VSTVVKRAFDSAFGSPDHSSPFRAATAHYVPATDIETDDDASSHAHTHTLAPVALSKRSRLLDDAQAQAQAQAQAPGVRSLRPDTPFRAAGARRTLGATCVLSVFRQFFDFFDFFFHGISGLLGCALRFGFASVGQTFLRMSCHASCGESSPAVTWTLLAPS
jgi:hypothetical protein